MSFPIQRLLSSQVNKTKSTISGQTGLSLLESLGIDELIKQYCGDYRERIYSPLVCTWIFLAQVLNADQSCRQAVMTLYCAMRNLGAKGCSTLTGSYCKARQRLSEEFLKALVHKSGQLLEEKTLWRWKGRSVKIVDGSSVRMPDTAANHAQYPMKKQPCGNYPVARILAIFSLGSGAILDFSMEAFEGKGNGELSQLRALLDRFRPTDVLLADRHYCCYWLLAVLKTLGVDSVVRLHLRDKRRLKRRKRISKSDWLVELESPIIKGFGVLYKNILPPSLPLRWIKVQVTKKGYRTKNLEILTTFTDPAIVTQKDIAELYKMRWYAELDLRSLKIVMQMDCLRCKQPQSVRKEVWVHLLAYNLVRTVIGQIAESTTQQPRTISFKACLQLINALSAIILLHPKHRLYPFLATLSQHTIGNRPDRIEPRALKSKRRRRYPDLKQPRYATTTHDSISH